MHDSDSRLTNDRLLALRPPGVMTRRLIAERLHGAATSARWLPEGLSEENKTTRPISSTCPWPGRRRGDTHVAAVLAFGLRFVVC